ncbi:hypothetical protein F5Y16DRAFT_164693 [Xylariaceae sp. FL0255]|nr:hypothetical protein F5Y16DRAFT_164693 [Xylariaceae sp. FL0255]
MAPTIKTLPAELCSEIMAQLTDYKDLINLICAVPKFYAAFKESPVVHQKQIVMNNMDTEWEQIALATAYCPQNTGKREAGGSVECQTARNGRISTDFDMQKHIRMHLGPKSTFLLPSTSKQLEDLYKLCRLVDCMAYYLFQKARQHYSELVNKTASDSPILSLPPSSQLRTALQKALWHFEFMARTVGSRNFYRDPKLRELEHRIFQAINPVEMAQLNTVHRWISGDYAAWIRDFQNRLCDEILDNSYSSLTANDRPGPDESEVGGTVDLGHILAGIQEDASIPYLVDARNQGFPRSWNESRLAFTLESAGLRRYAATLQDLEYRHTRITFVSTYRGFLPNDFLSYGIAAYYRRKNDWFDHLGEGGTPIPNSSVEKFVGKLRRLRPLLGAIPDREKTYLMATGWWFWDDEWLKTFDFADIYKILDAADLYIVEGIVRTHAVATEWKRRTIPFRLYEHFDHVPRCLPKKF